MADRSRRVRKQVSDMTDHSLESSDGDSGEEFNPTRGDATRRVGLSRHEFPRSKKVSNNISPLKAGARVTNTVSDPNKQSIKLTMKVPPSKLREVMRVSEIDSLKDTLGGGTVLDAPRSSRRATTQTRIPAGRANGRPRYTEQFSDEGEEDDDDDDDDDDDAEGAEDTTMQDFDEDEEVEEVEEDEEDIEMSEAPQMSPSRRAPTQPRPPKITLKAPAKTDSGAIPKPKLVVTPASVGQVQSVEDQEMDDDEEAGAESDLDDEEDETNLNDEDIEGEDELLDEDDDVEGEEDSELPNHADVEVELDEDDDDDDDSLESGMATPDPSKMTARQRGRAIEPLVSLDMAPQQRKFFTDAEKAMKKDEHARKRKELTKRKVQEEKIAALNRLLKPQANKSRGAAPKAENLAAQLEAAIGGDEEPEKADPLYTRWISSKDGIRLGVPEEWLGKRVASCFGPPLPPSNGVLVQEVD